MGMSKIINEGDGKVRVVHQLNSDGTPYAEDVTIEVQPGVSPERLAWLAAKDGETGTFSWVFTSQPVNSDVLFPE